MSGHSHWASIKHKKGAEDAKKGKLFSKLAKNIMIAAKAGANPDDNLRLRYAIDAAKAVSMPKDSIERAVKKGSGELEGGNLEELSYEGIGPGGASLVVDVLTDNRNRIASEIRTIFDKRGGTMGKAGSVSWKFDRKGILEFSRQLIAEDELYEVGIEAGAENIAAESDFYVVTTKPADFEAVRQALLKVLEAKKPKAPESRKKSDEEEKPIFSRAELTRVPQNTVPIDPSKVPALLTLLNELEDHEDVQKVTCDFDIPEDVLRSALAKI
jgi:YebC/PmpR family DNA-binding regulatory protein